MKKISKKLKAGLAKCLSAAKENAGTALSALILFSGITVLAMKAPEMHEQFLRHKVGSRVLLVTIDAAGNGGGTGFQVKAPSGKSYILTNDHICEHAQDGILWVTGQEGRAIPRRVVERSDFSDLCILDGMPGLEGLTLGSEPYVGEHVSVVGHPKLQPLVVSEGQVTGAADVPLISHMIDKENPESTCQLPKNKIEHVEIAFLGIPIGTIDVCMNVTHAAYISTAVIFPGNSGSPAVDFWGRVMGVAFASDDTNWGRIVNLSDIVKMLSKY